MHEFSPGGHFDPSQPGPQKGRIYGVSTRYKPRLNIVLELGLLRIDRERESVVLADGTLRLELRCLRAHRSAPRVCEYNRRAAGVGPVLGHGLSGPPGAHRNLQVGVSITETAFPK